METITNIFDLDNVLRILRLHEYRQVTLQFPDDVLSYCVVVYQYLVNQLGGEYSLFIVADSTFGSSIDDISAMHVDSQVIVYFGSDLSSSGTIPVIVVPPQKTFNSTTNDSTNDSSIDGSNDVHDCAQKLIDASRLLKSIHFLGEPVLVPSSDVIIEPAIMLIYDPCYYRAISNIASVIESIIPSHLLEAFRSKFRFGKLPANADLVNWSPKNSSLDTKQEKLGGIYFSDSNCLEHPNTELWYIGSKREQISSIILSQSKLSLVTYDPDSKETSLIEGSSSREFQERIGGMLKVEHVRVVGLLVGSMGLSKNDSQAILERLRLLLEAAGKKHYTLVMGRLNAAKLSNFPEIGLYCLISNEDTALISAKSYHVPVISPFELELGLGAMDWSSKFLTDSTSILTNGLPLEEAIRNVRRTRVERGQESDEDEDEDELEIKRMVAADVANIKLAVEEALGPSRASSSKAGATASAPIAAASSSALADCGRASCDCEDAASGGRALIRREIPEGRITVFESAGLDYFQTRSFKGLDASIPENHSTDILPGQFGTARGYISVGTTQDIESTSDPDDGANTDET